MQYVAIDLGAESGRVMLGSLAKHRVQLEELHRFPTGPVRSGDSLFWNTQALMRGVCEGFGHAAARGVHGASVSIDSWGVDYLLFDRGGNVVEPTFHYRDPRSERGTKHLLSRIPWPGIFDETGIQYLPINTAFQLAAESPERLAKARHLLLIADGLHYWLTGEPRAEVSLASTSQLYNPRSRSWSSQLINALQLVPGLLPPIIPSGTAIGTLRPEIARETGLRDARVVASCSHDTAAAVVAVPAQGDNWAYLSSGTWSLLGVELSEPVMTQRCRELNFTNEIGFGHSVRLLKNIIGLWLVQECRREWVRAGRDFDYPTLTRMAEAAPAFSAFINPADPRFLGPDNMPRKIAAFCRETGQRLSDEPGAVIRCVLESLALLYRKTVAELEQLAPQRIERLHIVGGGSRNGLLNQFTANALGIPVLAGPVEATALGNVFVQAIERGELRSLSEAREISRRSDTMKTYEPRDVEQWSEAWARFAQMP